MAALAVTALAAWIVGCDLVDATAVAAAVVSVMVLGGIVAWDEVLAHKSAWNILVWFATLVTLAEGLNRVGVIAWLTRIASARLSGLPPGVVMVALVALFFFVHYLFASLAAHTAAVLPVVLATGAAVPGIPITKFALLLCYSLGLMGVLTASPRCGPPTRSCSGQSAAPTSRTTSRCGACSCRCGAASPSTRASARVKLRPGVTTPLANRSAKDIDFVIVRENDEGEYSRMGGRIYEGSDEEVAIQESVFTRRGVDRILEYAFRLAGTRRGHVTSATKSYGIFHTMPYWDERFGAAAARHPGVRTAQYHVDILAAHFVQHPDWFDVVVGSKLLGDILSDLGAAVAGSIGIAPSANLNPERTAPSMFEPVHGSAPDIAGRGVANPVATVWATAMMLDHLGHAEAARTVERAIDAALDDPRHRTPDLGGPASNREAAEAIVRTIP